MDGIGIEVQFQLDSFQFDQGLLREAIKGPVMSDLIARAVRVEAQAKRNATGEGGGPSVRTGRLRASIYYSPGYDAQSPYVDVGTSLYYAPFVEFGHQNRAHAYPITTPGGTRTGAFGYVSNKPTRPYPFLRPAAQAARTT